MDLLVYYQPAHKWIESWLVTSEPAEIRSIYDRLTTYRSFPHSTMQLDSEKGTSTMMNYLSITLLPPPINMFITLQHL